MVNRMRPMMRLRCVRLLAPTITKTVCSRRAQPWFNQRCGSAASLKDFKDGVLIHENSPVTNPKWTGDWTATTPNGQVTAPQVILAVNGHLNSFGYAKSTMHVFTYASMTRALSPQELLSVEMHWGDNTSRSRWHDCAPHLWHRWRSADYSQSPLTLIWK